MKCITIIGNLGANAVRRMTSEGKELMSFNVAVNQQNGDPVWFNCVGNLREKLLPFLVKGQSVCVMGDLKAGLFNNQIELSISIDRVELCGKAPESSQSSDNNKDPEPVKEVY